jgi:hypothetical protein
LQETGHISTAAWACGSQIHGHCCEWACRFTSAAQPYCAHIYIETEPYTCVSAARSPRQRILGCGPSFCDPPSCGPRPPLEERAPRRAGRGLLNAPFRNPYAEVHGGWASTSIPALVPAAIGPSTALSLLRGVPSRERISKADLGSTATKSFVARYTRLCGRPCRVVCPQLQD